MNGPSQTGTTISSNIGWDQPVRGSLPLHTKWHQRFRQLRWDARREFQSDEKNSLNQDLEQVQKHLEGSDPKHATLEKSHHKQYVHKIFKIGHLGGLWLLWKPYILEGYKY